MYDIIRQLRGFTVAVFTCMITSILTGSMIVYLVMIACVIMYHGATGKFDPVKKGKHVQ